MDQKSQFKVRNPEIAGKKKTIENTPQNTGLDKNFLNKILTQEIAPGINKCTTQKKKKIFKCFYTAKETLSRINSQPIGWEGKSLQTILLTGH